MPDPTPEQQEAWDLSQIKQRHSRLNAKPIGSVIRNLMARRGYGQTQAIDELLHHWRQAVGPTLANSTRPGNVSRGVLQVWVADSPSLQELSMCKRQVLQALQTAMPQAGFVDLRPKIGAIN